MAKRRRRRLKDIGIEEVSFVDHPANRTPFLFFKNGDGAAGSDIEKVYRGLDVTFSAKDGPGDTKINVNGRQIDGATHFYLAYSPLGSDRISLNCAYTLATKGETAGGFSSSRSYSLYKNADGLIVEEDGTGKAAEEKPSRAKKADEADYELIKAFLAGDVGEWIDNDIAKGLVPHIAVIERYKEDLPPDLAEAIKSIVKVSTTVETVDNEENETVEKDEENTEQPTVDTDALVEAIVPKVTEGVLAALDERAKTQAEEIAAAAAAAKEAEDKAEAEQSASGEEDDVDLAEAGKELAQIVVDTLNGGGEEDEK